MKETHTNQKKNIALVLGSGGARGLAHIGVIEELERRNYKISAISGCSMGAVIGAVYASGELDDFKQWICNLDRYGVFNLMDFTLTSQGFIKGDRVFNEMKKFVSARNIEDLKIPFTAVAVDIKTGNEFAFTKGDLFDAVRASVAIPSVLTPVYMHDSVFVDGGVINPLPMDKLIKGPNDMMVAVDLNARKKYYAVKNINVQRQIEIAREESRWKKALANLFFEPSKASKKVKKHDYFDILNGSFDIMQGKLTEVLLHEYKPDVLINVPKTAAKTFEFFKATEIIEYGREEAKKAFDILEKIS